MDDKSLDIILSGHDPLERVVAVEPVLERGVVELFVRSADGASTSVVTRPFVPWLLAREQRHFEGATTSKLEGDGYAWRTDFERSGWQGFQRAKWAFNDEHIGLMQYGSATKQFLIASGITLFKGMGFDDLRRMQIDIETSSLYTTDPKAGIFMISVGNNKGETDVLTCPDEGLLLEQLQRKIFEWDPDVIEGHNLYGFDLPYIAARFEAHGMPCVLGRNPDKAMERGQERNCAIGTNSRPFAPHYIYGRHIIDTLLQVQRFDWARAQISSYNLKECARVYGIAPPDRVYLDRADITEIFRQDPQKVTTYARQDVEEARSLAELVAPTEFYQTQLVPDAYQAVAVTGNGEKLNSLLVREYLREGQSVPLQSPPQEYPGGYTEVRHTGVIKPIVKADVESLYPSIMLTRRIKPKADRLDIFLPLLNDLTNRRLDAKRKAQAAKGDERQHHYWDGLQSSYKSIINSFYGYIGGPFYFNDFLAARAVTEAGREIVLSIAAKLEEEGSLVIEIDTDGVYFRPPDDVRTEEDELEYVKLIGSSLPEGIRLAHDGSYEAMLSLKMKNYVLVEPGGRKIYKGSSLRSRADEPYGRKFLTHAIDLLLDGDTQGVANYYGEALERIYEGETPIDDLVKRERVTSKTISSVQRGRADALRAANVKVGDIVQTYQRADRTLALRDSYAGDEDRDYYGEKLYKFAGRLREAFTDMGGEVEFDRIFPKPLSAAKRLAAQHQNAFDF